MGLGDLSNPTLLSSIGEFDSRTFPNSTTLGAAVAEAAYMAGMEANADVVQLATYGDLMANSEDQHGSAGVSTILIDADDAAAVFGRRRRGALGRGLADAFCFTAAGTRESQLVLRAGVAVDASGRHAVPVLPAPPGAPRAGRVDAR